MAHHSSVNYIEPNISSLSLYKSEESSSALSWRADNIYERAPRLEDYSIYFNLEVEVCSRDNISSNKKIATEVLILSYRTAQGGSASTVNFMGGTKVKCNDTDNSFMQYLTTNYADMYVGDLIDYGTTEMIGVKSIDVEYQSSCVPIVTVKFTDVRGLSLFQPTELSRTNSYQGINGINSDNVAQSFFQCFFRVPMPRFTMTIKGFYGKPVTYECMCDKFDTDFNSSTGDFDITARFIGYGYSFLTDVSIDALFAAPYSDYGGEEGIYNSYWVREKKSGRFTIWNKERTQKIEMPTLLDIWQQMKTLSFDSTDENTALIDEGETHEEEIQELQDIREKYKLWYSTLFNVCVERYGKDYCYLFRYGNDGDYYRIMILTKFSNEQTLQGDYEQFPDDFKKVNKDLYAAIKKYNEGDGFKKLENTSIDFGDYCSLFLFNNMYLGKKGEVVFNGFHRFNKLQETDVVKNVFYGVDYHTENATQEEIRAKEAQHKKHVLETIYGDGTDQYTRCYSIELDYSSITSRIKALQAESNLSRAERDKKNKIKQLNKEMLDKMKWYPSVENFTRIMMAHLETLMNMLYNVVSKCENRTAEELGITTGENGNCPDVNASTNKVPPFPRVTKNILGDDNITKVEDTWVGEYNKGTKAFEEVDFIDGFFNAIEKIQNIRNDTQKRVDDMSRAVVTSSEDNGGVIKHPLSSFDFYITKSPYGDSKELMDDYAEFYQFAGKVAIRMFNILCINHFRRDASKMMNDEMIMKIARVEADNFNESVRITNENFLGMLRNDVITSDAILTKVTIANSDNCPWGNIKLFSDEDNHFWLNGYKVKYGNGTVNYIYPIQDVSFSKLKEIYANISQGGLTNGSGNISLYTLPMGCNELNMLTDNAYGNVMITDKINIAENVLTDANSNCDSGYTEYYNTISSLASFNEDFYSSFVRIDDTPSVCGRIKPSKITTFSIDGEAMKLDDANNELSTYENNSVESLGTRAKEGNTDDFTITEVFGITEGMHDYESSFKNSESMKQAIPMAYGNLSMDARNAIALLSIKTNETVFKQLFKDDSRTFVYLPKLALLQIGALCFATKGVNNQIYFKGDTFINSVTDSLKVDKSFIPSSLATVVTLMSKQARFQYARYFYDWVLSNNIGKKFIEILLSDGNYVKPSCTTNRALLNENAYYVKMLTHELLSPMLIINLSVNCEKDIKKLSFTKGQAKTYLDAFIKRLKDIYKIGTTDEENNLVKTTKSPTHTNDEMKIELYRYMKQLYDKWIPMSSLDDWALESFFINDEDGKKSENTGHTFYFIDSYYNKIGHKLLINPKNLMERIDALLSGTDVNAMMLGFMADIYAYNRCMMKCIQNFADLSQRDGMAEMFTPMPFNSIDWNKEVNKHSSFVIIYPYEPSKNLNIPNNEYNDDSFMLNDENETPKAIITKDSKQYMIPAFGVSYGKQYQSYFKAVNVNMQSPIATQQAIKAKHYILQESASVKEKGVVGQDLYDIYTTQSYTCNVEMMGCAWIQPLMYFVLLNIPMFRGSYLVMKVKHSIKPGDMSTTFSGCRMANVSNRLIENMFTDDDFLSNDENYDETISNRSLKADLDNDCPYKVYPLYSANGSGADLSDELTRKVQLSDCYSPDEYKILKDDTILMALSRIVAREGGQNSQELELQEMLVATTIYNRRVHNGSYKNTIFKQKQYDIKKAAETTPKDWVIDIVKNIFTQSPSWILTKYNTTTVKNNGLKAHSNSSNFKKGATITRSHFTLDDLRKIVYFANYQEIKNGSNKWVLNQPIILAQDSTSNGVLGHTFNAEPNEPFMWEVQKNDSGSTESEDINDALFNAIKKSAKATPSIGVELAKGRVNGYYVITQADKKSDKLGLVFDMILNSEYYDKIQKLYWVYASGGLQSDPAHIDYIASESPSISTKSVRIAQSGGIGATENNSIPSDSSEKLLKAIGKRYASVGKEALLIKEIPQTEDKTNKGHILDFLNKYKPQSCESMFISNDNQKNDSMNGYSGQVTNEKMKKVLSDVNHFYLKHRYGESKSYRAVSGSTATDAPYTSGMCTYAPSTWYNNAGNDLFFYKDYKSATHNTTTLGNYGMKMVWHGTIKEALALPISTFRPGDVSTQYYYKDKEKTKPSSHGCMWTGKDWRSDFVQRTIMASTKFIDRDGKYSVCLWRHPDFQEKGLPLV